MFSKTNARNLNDDVRAALEKIAAKHGVTLAKCKAGYDDTMCRVSVEFGVIGEDGTDLRAAATMPWGHEGDVGRTVKWNGETYRVDGCNRRAARFPIEATRVRDGKRFRLPMDVLKKAGAK